MDANENLSYNNINRGIIWQYAPNMQQVYRGIFILDRNRIPVNCTAKSCRLDSFCSCASLFFCLLWLRLIAPTPSSDNSVYGGRSTDMGCLYFSSSPSPAFSYSPSLCPPLIYYFAVIHRRKHRVVACKGNMVHMALQATACRGRGEVMSQFMTHLPHFS